MKYEETKFATLLAVIRMTPNWSTVMPAAVDLICSVEDEVTDLFGKMRNLAAELGEATLREKKLKETLEAVKLAHEKEHLEHISAVRDMQCLHYDAEKTVANASAYPAVYRPVSENAEIDALRLQLAEAKVERVKADTEARNAHASLAGARTRAEAAERTVDLYERRGEGQYAKNTAGQLAESLRAALADNGRLREEASKAKMRRDAWARRVVALQQQLNFAEQRETRCKVAIHDLGQQRADLAAEVTRLHEQIVEGGVAERRKVEAARDSRNWGGR